MYFICSYTRRAKLGDSRSTGRLHAGGGGNKSMTRLNIAGGSVGGLHKSMTRLSSSQLLGQYNGGKCGGKQPLCHLEVPLKPSRFPLNLLKLP